MLQDIQDAVSKGIISEIKSSATDDGEYFYSVIVDESSDMSNHEQLSLSLSSVNSQGKKSEDFVKLIKVPHTTGEYLCEVLVKQLEELGLDTASCVSLAGDGASNISGHEKGLAVRFKEFAPLCVYVHCYAHRLNLAIKDLLSSIQLLRNVLGTVQEIYNFLEGSPKRSEIFKSAEVEDEDTVTKLKNQGATRWGAKGDSVIAVSKELKRVVKALDIITKDKDAKVSAKAKSLVRNIYGEEFVFGITLLETLLTPVNKLSDYLQGRNVDMRKARESVKLLITTLEGLKNEERFNELWQLSQRKSAELKLFVEEDDTLDIYFDFDEAKVPRRLKWTKSPKEYFRVTHFESSLDKIIADLNVRFMDKDKNIILDMVAIVNDAQVDGDVFSRVGEYYSIDADDLKSEHQMFQHFKVIKYFHHLSFSRTYNIIQENIDTTEMVSAEIAGELVSREAKKLMPNLFKVVKLLATMPISSCEAERSFSTLRRIKNHMRTTMGQERLSALNVIAMHRARVNRVLLEQMDELIDTFASRKNRKAYFF